jgi:phosphate transport system substrate-binding protein
MSPGHKRVYCLFGILVAFLTLTLVACGGPATEPAPTPSVAPRTNLTISGSGTTTSILSAVKPKFEADLPGYNLDVLPGTGTGEGVQGAIQGVLDVAAMARPSKEDEAAQGIEYVEFGQSGVAILTHSGVDVANLTTAQVKALFSGEVTNWSEVGGPNLPIILYVRDEGDSSTKALRQAIVGDTPFPETAPVLTSQTDMQAAIAGTPGGVGFGSWSAALATKADVRSVTLDGLAPGDPAYPMLSPVGIGYLSARKADVQPLIDWLLSGQGRTALSEFDVITASH